jgi:hypothetical protein
MSLLKHFGEQSSDDHGGRLFWSQALGGLPFRGPFAPTLSQEEVETQVGVTFDFKSEVFDLSDETQRKRYVAVMDRIVNRWYVLHHIERQMIQAEKKAIVYLEWSQRYGELNPSARAARSQGYVLPIHPEKSAIVPIPLAGLQNPSYG